MAGVRLRNAERFGRQAAETACPVLRRLKENQKSHSPILSQSPFTAQPLVARISSASNSTISILALSYFSVLQPLLS